MSYKKKGINVLVKEDSEFPTKGTEPTNEMVSKYIEVKDRIPMSVEDDTTPSEEAVDIDEGEDTGSIKRLEDIQGIGPAAAGKLRLMGYTVMGLATARADVVAGEMGVSQTIAKAWCNVAREAALAKMKTYTAEEYDIEQKAKQIKIRTGSAEFNNMLGGGIPTMSITGSSARFSSGKTQIGYDAVIDVLSRILVCPKCKRELFKLGDVCPEDGEKAVHAKAAIIETEPDTFHLDRLKEIAFERDIKGINWGNLFLYPAKQIPTAKAQFLQYKVIQKLLEGTAAKPEQLEKKRPDGSIQIPYHKAVAAKAPEPIIFIDIDSMNAKFRDGWSESQMLPIRTREFAAHFTLMEYLAATYNIAFYLTHQVIAPVRPDQGLKVKIKFLDEFYPVGGDYVLHSVNNWIALSSVGGDVEQAQLFDSSYLPKNECFFKLTARGLSDAGKLMDKKLADKAALKAKEAVTAPIKSSTGIHV